MDIGMRTVSVRVTAPGGRTATASIPVDVRQAPPAGPVGISIDDGAPYTNDPAVAVRVTWPPNALTVTLSNDGGFAGARAVPVDSPLAWRVTSTGSERQPRVVYARFDDATQTFQDDIVLDQGPPTILSAIVRGAKPRWVRVRDGADNLSRWRRLR